MVDLDQKEDLSWLINMGYGKYFITQALKQNQLKIDEKGAQASSATAIAMGKSFSGPRSYIIDRPFVVWFERAGNSFVSFVAYVDYDSWKTPKR